MKEQRVLITERDRIRLLGVLARLRAWGDTSPADLDALTERLESATVIEGDDIPRSIVTMNSLVGLRDLDLNEKFCCTLSAGAEKFFHLLVNWDSYLAIAPARDDASR